MNAAHIEQTINRYVEWVLRHWVAVASVWAALVVVGAVVTPLLAANGYDTASWLLYTVYRVICPQRPSHSWFIEGYKMGFEQRDTAMFVAGALAGPLYILAKRLGFRQLSGKAALLLTVPMLYDVFSQMIGLRDSDGFWRSVTGSLAVFGMAGWLYPRIDSDFRAGLAKLEHARRARQSQAALGPLPPGGGG
jgi:uncharacterized membrane protein